MTEHKRQVEALASELFGELTIPPKKHGYLAEYRFTCLVLDENNAPIIILHDGRGNTLATARWDGEKWYKEES